MSDIWVHRVSDLAAEERRLVERWLGRAVSEDETISLNAYKPHSAPVGPEREALRREIVSQAHEIGSRAQEISEEEAGALADEALAEIHRKRARESRWIPTLVRAVISPRGPALQLLDIVLGAHTLVLSRFILDEVQRALLYPRIQARYRITPEEAARFAGTLADASHRVEPVVARAVILSDPEDDPVLYTAADGKADVLCTRNIRHFETPEVRAFCAERRIRVMTDLDVLHDLRGGV